MSTMTYGQLVEAYVAVRDERDRLRDDLQIAEDRLDWLRKRVRLAMDLLCSPTVPHEPGPDVPGAYGILSHALATTAPETGLSATQTDEQTQVEVETGTETASARVDLVVGLRQRGVPQHPDGPEAAALAEIDRLRTERDRLRRRLGDVLDLEELPEDHTIVAAVRRLRALGTTPDTGRTA